MEQQIPYTQLSRGTLLIASPEIDAGFYFRAVIVMCEHLPSGSFGIILNKSLDVELPGELFNMDELANRKLELRSGGPIQPSQMMLLHSSTAITEQTLEICKGVYLGGDLPFLQEAVNDTNGPFIRLCFGYAGWATGQLEREYLMGNWFLHPASAHLIFEVPHDKLWRTALREMGGKYATLSMIPDDLSVN